MSVTLVIARTASRFAGGCMGQDMQPISFTSHSVQDIVPAKKIWMTHLVLKMSFKCPLFGILCGNEFIELPFALANVVDDCRWRRQQFSVFCRHEVRLSPESQRRVLGWLVLSSCWRIFWIALWKRLWVHHDGLSLPKRGLPQLSILL